jgi:hypothetical protein
MKKILQAIKFTLVTIAGTLIITSCLNSDIEQKIESANNKLNTYLKDNNYTQDEHIGMGVYVRITEESSIPDAKLPVYPNAVRLNYTGRYTSGEIFQTTDSTLSDHITYGEYYIYGDKRLYLGNIYAVGFDTAIRTIPVGASAQIVIPYELAFGNYEPVVYDVELLEIIENDSIWEADNFSSFLENNGFDTSKYIAPGLFYKTVGDFTGIRPKDSTVLEVNDSLEILVNARYAEDFYDDNTGRLFYPRYGESVLVQNYLWGTTSDFPIEKFMDSTVKYMYKGQTLEVAFKSGMDEPIGQRWGYELGLADPFNILIIPPYQSLHYTVALVESEKED